MEMSHPLRTSLAEVESAFPVAGLLRIQRLVFE